MIWFVFVNLYIKPIMYGTKKEIFWDGDGLCWDFDRVSWYCNTICWDIETVGIINAVGEGEYWRKRIYISTHLTLCMSVQADAAL